MRVFGFGGQGIITMAGLIGQAAIIDRKEVIMTEEYSPYITGGWSRADLIVSDRKIDYPMISEMDYLITLSQEGFDTNLNRVTEKGMIFVERDLVKPSEVESARVVGIRAKQIADSLGSGKIANIVMLGYFNQLSGLVSKEALAKAVKNRFPKFEQLNLSALDHGYREGETNA